MTKQLRYRVTYGPGRDYALLDTTTGKHVFTALSKSEVIAEAQRQNGFEVDGDEQTYGRQVRMTSNPLAERFS